MNHPDATPEPHDTCAVKKRVLIVDDHPIFRQGIAQLINLQPDLEVCGDADSARRALDVIEQLGPDMIIMDISLQSGGNGIELMKSVKVMHPTLPVLIVSMHDENIYAERALRAGARGYVMKQAPAEQVMTALREVLKGGALPEPSHEQPDPGDVRHRRGKGPGLHDRAVERP